jgi:hypothetical protein
MCITLILTWFAASLVCGPIIGKFCGMTGSGR